MKPIFPVLLSGKRWSRLADIQFENAASGIDYRLSSDFVDALHTVVPTFTGEKAPPPLPAPLPGTVMRDERDAPDEQVSTPPLATEPIKSASIAPVVSSNLRRRIALGSIISFITVIAVLIAINSVLQEVRHNQNTPSPTSIAAVSTTIAPMLSTTPIETPTIPTKTPTQKPSATLLVTPTRSPTYTNTPTYVPTASITMTQTVINTPTALEISNRATSRAATRTMATIWFSTPQHATEQAEDATIDAVERDSTAAAKASRNWSVASSGNFVCNDWILYHSNRSGMNTWDIFRVDLKTNAKVVNLTKSPLGTLSISPSLSPDSRYIAFYTNRDKNWEVYVAATDGQSDPQRISYNTFAIDQDPVWSPDGKYILYESSRRGNFDLYVVDVTIGPDSETSLSAGPANDVNAVFSPDGTSIIYESQSQGTSQIFSYDLASQKTTKISDGKGADFNPTYSADSKKIAYRSYRDNGTVATLYVADANGANAVAITDSRRSAVNHVWSPDGTLIAYQSDVDGVMSIYVYELVSGKTRLVTSKIKDDNQDSVNYAPTWSCRNSTLFFTSDDSGAPNIYSTAALPMNAPPINVLRQAVQITTGTGTEENKYPLGYPTEEDASRLGLAPTTPTRR